MEILMNTGSSMGIVESIGMKVGIEDDGEKRL